MGGSTPECLIDEPLVAGFADDPFQGVLLGRRYVHVCLKQAPGTCPVFIRLTAPASTLSVSVATLVSATISSDSLRGLVQTTGINILRLLPNKR